MPNIKGCDVSWANQTVIHPVSLLAFACLGMAILLLPRRWAVIPVIVMACFIPPAQRIVIATLDFSLLRLLVLFGWVRIAFNRETKGLNWHWIDVTLLAWAFVGTVSFTVLLGSWAALVHKLGESFDALGMYFLLRCFIRSWTDLYRAVLGFIAASVPIALAFVIEHSTGRNIFAFFGEMPVFVKVRAGNLRCQGAFADPIMAGCFWASLMPLFAAFWWGNDRWRYASIVGLTNAALVVWLCKSSTPVVSVLCGMLGALVFVFRFHMRLVRWIAVFVLVFLHMVMSKPVWHLVARVDIVHGSAGWHRYSLIDQAVKRFEDWWLFGTRSTADWGDFGLLRDVTNHYVLEGVRGGILTLGLFSLMIVLAFREVGFLWREVARDQQRLAIAWALGVALFVHAANFIAVSYFGQIYVVWYFVLAAIASLGSARTQQRVPVLLR